MERVIAEIAVKYRMNRCYLNVSYGRRGNALEFLVLEKLNLKI